MSAHALSEVVVAFQPKELGLDPLPLELDLLALVGGGEGVVMTT